MGYRIRRKLNKKERSAKVRADEKNRKYFDRNMMRDLDDEMEEQDEYDFDGMEEDYMRDNDPEGYYYDEEDAEECYVEEEDWTEEEDIDSDRWDEVEDPEDYDVEDYDEESDEIFDSEEEDNKLAENSGIPVSLLSFITIGGLGLLVVVMMAVYAGVTIAGGTKEEQPETQADPVTVMTEAETEVSENSLSWITGIFGNENADKDLELPAVYGLSDRMKKKLQFDESEFTRDVAAFLKENGIDTELLYLENTVPVSSDSAVGFIASMAGVADQKLEMIFYPEYPDHFIFMLTEKEKVEVPVNQISVSETENTAVSNTSVPETESSLSSVVTQTDPVRVYQTPETNENTYDASRLSVTSIPSELKNYISNEYMLQYQLYDYLYNNGMRKVRTAKVTEYSIDGDVRQATFRIGLDNGQTVACTFYHDSGSYSFS